MTLPVLRGTRRAADRVTQALVCAVWNPPPLDHARLVLRAPKQALTYEEPPVLLALHGVLTDLPRGVP